MNDMKTIGRPSRLRLRPRRRRKTPVVPPRRRRRQKPSWLREVTVALIIGINTTRHRRFTRSTIEP